MQPLRSLSRHFQTNIINPLQSQFNSYFDEATQHLHHSKKEYTQIIKNPRTTTKYAIPFIRQNGLHYNIYAYTCQHSYHTWPTKGGLRFSKAIDVSAIEALAAINTFRSALYEIPFGGSMTGIAINPPEFSKTEVEKILRRFTVEFVKKGYIGSMSNIISPEYGSDSSHMALIQDTYHTLFKGTATSACVSGKSVSQNGLESSIDAASYGILHCIKSIAQNRGFCSKYNFTMGLKGKTAIFYGFNSTARTLAKALSDAGVKLIAIIEAGSSIFNANGINIKRANLHWNAFKSFNDFYGSEFLIDKLEQKVYGPCDILISSSDLQKVDERVCNQVLPKILVEASDGSVTIQANKICAERGTVIVPDILCRVGDSISSYFEWLKDIEHAKLGRLTKRWDEQSRGMLVSMSEKGPSAKWKGMTEESIVQSGMEDIISASTDEVMRKWLASGGRTMRSCAYELAILKVLKVYEDCGITI